MSWPGTKAAPGISERLISLIPRHSIYLAPFAGECAVAQKMRPAERRIFVDRDVRALEFWRSREPTAELYHADSLPFLRFFFGCDRFGTGPRDPAATDPAAQSRGAGIQPPDLAARSATPDDASPARSSFVFVDPPYFPGTCTKGLYRYELTADDHVQLLATCLELPCNVMITGYRCDLYDSMLAAWDRIDYPVQTRRGRKIESAWKNYDDPAVLHDPRYIGADKRERERIRRRQRNALAMLERMDDRERQAFVEAIGERWA